MPVINLLVEGPLDEAVGGRLVRYHGAQVGVGFGKQGFGYIKQKIAAFARSSAGVPMIALVDLMDTGLPCAPEVVNLWLPHLPGGMLFRVVVPEIESWVMADRPGLAAHLGVRRALIPERPEAVDDPKQIVIEASRRSRRRDIREGMVPESPGASTGPRYNSILVEFIRNAWNLDVAAKASPSLASAQAAVGHLVAALAR